MSIINIPAKISQPVTPYEYEEVTEEKYEKYNQRVADNAAKRLSSADLSSLSLTDSKNGFSYYTLNQNNYTIGVVRDKEGEEIVKVVRNFHDRHSWVEKDGETYLITAEDYQGITVINCNQKWKQSYTPKDSVQGFGFCFSSATISPNGKFLMVCGCIWAHPYEIRIYKFDHPTQFPYKLVAAYEDQLMEDYKTKEEWIDNSLSLCVSAKASKEEDNEEIQSFIASIQADCDVHIEVGEESITFKFNFE